MTDKHAKQITEAITEISHGGNGQGSTPMGLEAVAMALAGESPYDAENSVAGALNNIAEAIRELAQAINFGSKADTAKESSH